MVECGRTSVYNPRDGERERMVHTVSERRSHHGLCVRSDCVFMVSHKLETDFYKTILRLEWMVEEKTNINLMKILRVSCFQKSD